MDFKKLSPLQLGESGSIGAIPALIKFIKDGNYEEKRLAASAVTKLVTKNDLRKECSRLVPFLIENLYDEGPQVVQYTLKALTNLDIDKSHEDHIRYVLKNSDKDYNIKLAKKALRCINTNININKSSYSSCTKNQSKKGFTYIIKEAFSGAYKIGTTKNLGEALSSLSSALPFEIKLIHTIWDENYHIIEEYLVECFEEKKTKGEWLKLEDSDIEFIRSEDFLEAIENLKKEFV